MTVDQKVLDEYDEDVIQFRKENMSHTSADEFLSPKGEEVEDYEEIHLSVLYANRRYYGRAYVLKTELELARKAMKEEGCKYVSNIDYCGPVIAARGLIPKKIPVD